jgi:rSAM/selenodomain-associated transferase 1
MTAPDLRPTPTDTSARTGSTMILLFLKFPEPGRVKTRLAQSVGYIRAAEIYHKMVAHVVSSLPANDPVTVMFDPPDAETAMRAWLAPIRASFRFAPQCAGDLGARLTAAFHSAFIGGAQKVAAIGGDCLDLDTASFEATWHALDTHDAVIGPATDGGYYLIASSRALPLFDSISWSSPSVLAQTLALAEKNRLRVHLLPTLHDIDTGDDWQRIQARLPD